ncbi:MAG: histidine kinase [Psychroserpens sp.]|uniref:sensor histidine kinase n=1 Tax=Psychroserpens sp. TaxID=2020870 RepID=UPI003CC25FA6
MFTKPFIFKIIKQVLLHFIFWALVLAFFTYFFGVSNKQYYDTFLFSCFLMPITISTTYVSIYKLIPDYLITKKYWRFALYTTYTLIISAYLLTVSIFFSLIYISNFDYAEMNPATKNIIFISTAVYLVVFLVSAFKLLKLNIIQISKTKTLESKILDTQLKLKEQELHYLKLQIHPHFLFNTLNTMYGFALKKSDKTPEMVLKLANLLDYVLYQTEKPLVLLSEELEHINDYIALEKMRFNDAISIPMTIDITSHEITIAPMLLLPFIENSFKHGSISNGTLTIDINLKANSDYIDFRIKNSNSENISKVPGIGLENIKKRLELLYPSQYELHIAETTAHFEVKLLLKNRSHV